MDNKDLKALAWYPRYTGDYAKKTKHLTMLEHGAYNLLLDHHYSTAQPLNCVKQCSSNAKSNGELIPDHSRIYRICGAITKDEQQAVDNVLSMFFILTDDGYINKKTIETLEKQTVSHQKRVESGRLGGSKKSNQSSSNNKSNAQAMLKQSESESDSLIKKKINKEKVSIDELSISHIQEWLDKKHSEGLYIEVDENQLLEKFKNYCNSKGKKYSDNVAALRNAFMWNDTPKKKGFENGTNSINSNQNNKSSRAARAIASAIIQS